MHTRGRTKAHSQRSGSNLYAGIGLMILGLISLFTASSTEAALFFALPVTQAGFVLALFHRAL